MNTKQRLMRLGFVSAIFCLFTPSPALTHEFCPVSNPVDTDKVEDINEDDKRHWLLCICGAAQPSGEGHVIADARKAETFLILLNDNFLARYDEDCTGELEKDEREKFLEDQRAGLDERINDAIKDAKKRASYRIGRWEKNVVERGGQVGHDEAVRTLSNPASKEQKVSVSYSLASDSAQKVQNAKFGFSFIETSRQLPVLNLKYSTALAFDFSWKEVDTDEASTVTKAADFLPLSYSVSPVKSLTFSASAGFAYLETEELDVASGVRDSRDDLAYVYKLGTTYQTVLPCLSLGLEYKIRTEEVFSERLSYEWLPTLTFDFTKSCKVKK